jgi:hypothetical protein
MKRQGDTNFYLCEVSSNMVIDATNKGNMSRFINHSCEPNTEMQKWTVEGETRVGIFALRDIKTGEELTYDYKYFCSSSILDFFSFHSGIMIHHFLYMELLLVFNFSALPTGLSNLELIKIVTVDLQTVEKCLASQSLLTQLYFIMEICHKISMSGRKERHIWRIVLGRLSVCGIDVTACISQQVYMTSMSAMEYIHYCLPMQLLKNLI